MIALSLGSCKNAPYTEHWLAVLAIVDQADPGLNCSCRASTARTPWTVFCDGLAILRKGCMPIARACPLRVHANPIWQARETGKNLLRTAVAKREPAQRAAPE